MGFIELQNVGLVFKTKTQRIEIFRDLNLTFHKGDFVTIVGPSGMGKSTLLNLISGFVKPTAGEILIDGKSLTQMKDKEICTYRNQRIGYIFQAYNLIPQFHVRDNVAVPLLLNGQPKDAVEKQVTALLEQVKMTDRAYEYPNTLSGGEQQRVAFARAIANSPDIILADEPTGNLDSTNAEKLMGMLEDLWKAGKTILCVTHDEKLKNRANTVINIEDIVYREDW